MRRILLALALSLGSLFIGSTPTVVEATHENCAQTPWVHWEGTSVDYATVLVWCGRGWFELHAYCYWPTYVVDNGVVVDIIKHWASYYGPPKHKEKEGVEDNEVATVSCTNQYYIMQRTGALAPSVIFWH